ncbi:MAG: MgtC/SapB family protein [Turneriella sp.]
MLHEIHPFALSLILGLLIGVEREHNEKTAQKTLGVRTFAFVALAGSLAAWLKNPPLAAVLAVAIFALILLGYWRSTSGHKQNADPGLTTEIAAIVTFCTGYVLIHSVKLGILIGLTTLALLISRGWIHRFVREKLRKQELTTATVLIILFFGVAPFLPDATIDPWGIVNPRSLLMLFTLIALLQFAGYAANRLFGARSGLALSGFLGGFVSSTAIFIALPETRRANPREDRLVIAHALLAVSATLIQLGLVITLAEKRLALALSLPLLVMNLTSTAIALILARGNDGKGGKTALRDPVEFRSVLKLALVLGGLIALVNLVHRAFDDKGLWLIAAVSGLFELQGVSLAIALDLKRGAISLQASSVAVMVAVAASVVSKLAIVAFAHRDRFGVRLAATLLLVWAAGIAVAVFQTMH